MVVIKCNSNRSTHSHKHAHTHTHSECELIIYANILQTVQGVWQKIVYGLADVIVTWWQSLLYTFSAG